MAETTPRAGRWAFQLARQRQWQILRRGWWLFALCVLVPAAGGLALGIGRGTGEAWFLAGVLMTSGLAFSSATVVLISGTAPTLMGGIAEGWTSEYLRAAVGADGTVFDHVPIDYGDIDHLVLARTGALVVETKWRSDGWDLDAPEEQRMHAAISQTARCVDVARKLLQRNAKVEVPVSGVLVLWGVISSDVRSATYGGIRILAGNELPAFLDSTFGGPERASAQVVADAAVAVEQFIEQRDAFEGRRNGPKPAYVVHGVIKPLRSAYNAILGALIGSIACPLLVVAAAKAGASDPVALLSGFAAALIGWLASRSTRWTAFGWGWLGGSTALLSYVTLRVVLT